MKLNKDNKLTKYPFKIWDKDDKVKYTALCATAVVTLGLTALGFGTMIQKAYNSSVAIDKQEEIRLETIESPEYKEYFNEQMKVIMESEKNPNEWIEITEQLIGNEGVKDFLKENGNYSTALKMEELENASNVNNLALAIGGFFLGILGVAGSTVLSTSANNIKKGYDHFATNRENVAYKQYVDRLENYEKALYPQDDKKEDNTLAEIELGNGQDMER